MKLLQLIIFSSSFLFTIHLSSFQKKIQYLTSAWLGRERHFVHVEVWWIHSGHALYRYKWALGGIRLEKKSSSFRSKKKQEGITLGISLSFIHTLRLFGYLTYRKSPFHSSSILYEKCMEYNAYNVTYMAIMFCEAFHNISVFNYNKPKLRTAMRSSTHEHCLFSTSVETKRR